MTCHHTGSMQNTINEEDFHSQYQHNVWACSIWPLRELLTKQTKNPILGRGARGKQPPSLYNLKEMYMCLTILVSSCCELAFAACHNVTIFGYASHDH